AAKGGRINLKKHGRPYGSSARSWMAHSAHCCGAVRFRPGLNRGGARLHRLERGGRLRFAVCGPGRLLRALRSQDEQDDHSLQSQALRHPTLPLLHVQGSDLTHGIRCGHPEGRELFSEVGRNSVLTQGVESGPDRGDLDESFGRLVLTTADTATWNG